MNALLKKLNAKPEQTAHLLDAPDHVRELLEADAGEVRVVDGLDVPGEPVQWMLGFAQTAAQVDEIASAAASRTQGDAIVWIAYPKKSSKRYSCEFDRDNGWDALGAAGFEPVRQVAVDEDWSALRFRRVEHIKRLTRGFALTDEARRRSSGFTPAEG